MALNENEEIAGKDRVKQSNFITKTGAALQRNREKSCSQKRFPSVALVSFTMARVSNLGVTWSFPHHSNQNTDILLLVPLNCLLETFQRHFSLCCSRGIATASEVKSKTIIHLET